MQDGLFHAEFADAPGELEVAAGIGRDEDVGAGGPDIGEFPFEKPAARLQLLEGEGARPCRSTSSIPSFPGVRPRGSDRMTWRGGPERPWPWTR